MSTDKEEPKGRVGVVFEQKKSCSGCLGLQLNEDGSGYSCKFGHGVSFTVHDEQLFSAPVPSEPCYKPKTERAAEKVPTLIKNRSNRAHKDNEGSSNTPEA